MSTNRTALASPPIASRSALGPRFRDGRHRRLAPLETFAEERGGAVEVAAQVLVEECLVDEAKLAHEHHPRLAVRVRGRPIRRGQAADTANRTGRP